MCTFNDGKKNYKKNSYMQKTEYLELIQEGNH